MMMMMMMIIIIIIIIVSHILQICTGNCYRRLLENLLYPTLAAGTCKNKGNRLDITFDENTKEHTHTHTQN